MIKQLWKFEAVDSWFFRESRPFDTIGGTQLKSTFPPPARTLVGAIRTAIGEANGVNWHDYQRGEKYESLRQAMGDADRFGRLDFQGPFPIKDDERLYPVPLLILKGKENPVKYYRLAPADGAVHCDLGKVRLPVLESAERGAKPLEDCWLTRAGMEKVLLGGLPDIRDIRKPRSLYAEEDRLGIGRDNRTRTNKEGLIYQTQHVRPANDVAIGIFMTGLDEEFSKGLRKTDVNKLGGEGRIGAFKIDDDVTEPFVITVPKPGAKVLLMLLTAGDFSGEWMPPRFQKVQQGNHDVWEGVMNGVGLRIVSAITGKPTREGGWDVANQRSRPLRSLVPAGSCYFCEAMDGDAQNAIDKLQGFKVGEESQLGRGELAAGIW